MDAETDAEASSDPRPRLVVRSGIAAVDVVPGGALGDALAAVPGTVISVGRMAWAARIGPERAYSIGLIADRFGLLCDHESRDCLDEIAERRDASRPVVESIDRDDRISLSILDEPSLAVETFRSIPGASAREPAGRLEVPLTRWTGGAIRACVDAHRLRLSPAAELALRRALEAPAREPPASGMMTADETAASVTMHGSGAYVVLKAGARAELATAFAALPGAKQQDRHGRRWMLPASPESARDLRGLLGRASAIGVDEPSRQWLREAPRWIARVDVESPDGQPRLTFSTRWGDPPASLDRLGGLSSVGTYRSAELSVANVREIATLRESESELTLGAGAHRALAWVAANPDEETVPRAQLDVAGDHGPSRFVIEPIWDQDVEAAFYAQEAHLLRINANDRAGASELPADAWPSDELARFIRVNGVHCAPAARAILEAALASETDEARLIALSRGTDAELVVDGLAGELMPFQRAGVIYALERRRVFLADEQGLGKTVQALATIQADDAYPAVVVCPASLKLNWLREARHWLPDRTAREVSGRAARSLADADILVLNYEIVAAHADVLDALGPRALILDESHYVKSAKAQRTRAVLDLAERLSPNALRLALTGTPVVNRPAELAPQLRVLGRLHEYGSARSFERSYTTGSARRRLHERLRASCYLRRRKQDVLDQLPDKRRAVVTVPLDNEPDYRHAEHDFIRWLRLQIDATGSGRLPDSARAIALVRLTALRRLAARGKLRAALSWIQDFSASEERLVVFAHHRDIQNAVLERFPQSSRIIGADRIEEREANVRSFQSDDGPSLCVASLEVASHGFTLTAAANVAFLELAWTPAKHDQAEDRVHRIGQDRPVTAWYLLAAGTIDERIANLLEDKRHVVDSLTDGGEAVSGTLVNSLLHDYAAAT